VCKYSAFLFQIQKKLYLYGEIFEIFYFRTL
jgi:hypothetical protein